MLEPLILDAVARAFAVGGFSVLGVAMAMAPRSPTVRLIGTLFFITAIGHVLDNCVILQGLDGHAGLVLHILSVMASGMFWLFSLTLFGDEPQFPTWRLWPPVLLTLTAVAALVSAMPVAHTFWLVYNFGTLLLAAHALLAIWRGWKGDLVEPRRRLRAPVMATAAVYVLFTASRDLRGTLGLGEGAPSQVQAIMLAILALGGAVALLRVDPVLMGSVAGKSVPRAASPTLDLVDQATLAKLSKAMNEEEVWRREDISIRNLADHVVTTEHRLRRLINGSLGHRNFAAFINAARIDAARSALRDPDQALRSIAAIAYDLGFGSLGPFNRAFRESVGLTPKAWRQGAGGAGIAES